MHAQDSGKLIVWLANPSLYLLFLGGGEGKGSGVTRITYLCHHPKSYRRSDMHSLVSDIIRLGVATSHARPLAVL